MIKNTKASMERNDLPYGLLNKMAADLGLPVRLSLRLNLGWIILFDKNRQIDLGYMRPLQ